MQATMNATTGMKRTENVVAMNDFKDASGASTPKSATLPSVGTPEASLPPPTYFRDKGAGGSTEQISPSVIGAGLGLSAVSVDVSGAVGHSGVTTPSATFATPANPQGNTPRTASNNAPVADDGSHHLLKHYLSETQRVDALAHFGTDDIKEAAKIIGKMGQRDLQAKFKLVYGQPTHSNNNEWLRRKLCEAIGALPMKPLHRHRGKKAASTRRSRAKQHPVITEGLSVKRTRIPSQKLRECMQEEHTLYPLGELGHMSGGGPGIHIRLSKDGVYRSKSLPAKSSASRASRAVDDTSYSHYTTATNHGGSGEDDSSYPYPDPFEQSLLPDIYSMPVVFGHSNSTTDLTELVNRVDREEKQQQEKHLTLTTRSPKELPVSDWLDDTDEVILLDIDSAPFNPALIEAKGLL